MRGGKLNVNFSRNWKPQRHCANRSVAGDWRCFSIYLSLRDSPLHCGRAARRKPRKIHLQRLRLVTCPDLPAVEAPGRR
jgi:hypothetical protein